MKCSKLFPVLFFLWGYLNLSFTQPNIYWSKVYDGGSFDDTRFMVKDSQGNYIVTGTSVVSDPGYTNYGVLTIKYDSLGNQKWLKIKDNPNNAMDDATGLLVDDSNDVYVSGTFGGTFFLVKYDNSGNEKWFKQFNAYFSDYTVLNKHICLDDDENIYFSTVTLNAGQRHSAIRKYSSQGELIWLKEFTDLGSTHNEPINIVYDGAAFFYLTGYTTVTDSNINYYITKFDKNGTTIWEKDYGTDSASTNQPRKIIIGYNSDLYLLGRRYTLEHDWDIDIFRLDTAGNKIWETVINGDCNWEDNAWDIIIDNAQNIYATGSRMKYIPPSLCINKFYTVKMDETGNFIWERVLEDSLNYDGIGLNLNLDDRNNLYVTGVLSALTSEIRYNLEIVKYDPLGTLLWSIKKNFYGGTEWPAATILNSDDDFTVFVTSGGMVMESNYITIRYSNNPLSVDQNYNVHQFVLNQNYPNPFNPVTTISYSIPTELYVTLKVYDILGNEIKTLVDNKQSPGNYNVVFDGSNLSSGIYFYKISAGNYSRIKKMILLK